MYIFITNVCRKFLKFAKEHHDETFKKMNWNENGNVFSLRDTPYSSNLQLELKNKTDKYIEQRKYYCSLHDNLIPYGSISLSIEENLFHFLKENIVKLCNNVVSYTLIQIWVV